MSPPMLQPKTGHVPIKQALRRAADFTKPAETNPEICDSVEVLAEEMAQVVPQAPAAPVPFRDSSRRDRDARLVSSD